MDESIPCPQSGTPARITERFRLASTAGPVEHLKTGCVNQHWPTARAETLAGAQPDPTRPPPSPHPPARSVTMVRADELAGVLGGAGAESRFLTASDGVRLHYLHWPSRPSPPWAVLIFLHGMASHAGWFGETAAHLNQHGVAVYGPDRRGSGHSGGPRGHLARYERALDDLEQMVELVCSEHPGTPVFLAASSWAAKLAVVYVAQRPGPLSGLVLPAVVLRPRVQVSPGFRLRVVVGHLVTPMAYLPIPLTPEQYTANPPYLEFIRADPLRLLEATAQLFWETIRLDRRRRRAAARLGLPLLVLHGEEDPMLDVPKTRRWFERLGLEDKTYRAYPGVGHGLDFAPDRAEYLADLLGWLRAWVTSGSPPPTGGGR
jgi:alpha-beta hydrolase superfamily lysophospholipase